MVVRAGAVTQQVDLSVPSLVGPKGARLPAPRVARVAFISVTTPSSIEGSTGPWPDPLIPTVDDLVGERRRGFPTTVEAGGDVSAWVDLFVPRDASPGIYRGEAIITSDGRAAAKVPIELLVHRFVLPRSSSLPVTFGFSAATAAQGHFGRAPTDAEARALTQRYALAALRHRISLHGGTFDPAPFSIDKSGKPIIDFRSYDDEVGPFLDGGADPGGPAAGARWSAFDLRVPGRLAGDLRVSYLRVLAAHLAERGWIDRVFEYTADEPPDDQLAFVRERAALTRSAAPSVGRLVTHALDPALVGAVDIWCPTVNLLDDKPGASNWPPRSAYDEHLRRGERLWWYQACMSHGCNIVGGPYFSGWPSYAIDAPAVAHRIMEWLTWRYRVGGELYFDTVDAYRGGDPFQDVRRHGGNGDGTLFYPGRPSSIGGTTDIPVESIRLQRIRDGLEDYEYLTLLERKLGRAAADRIVARVARRTFDWEHDPARLLAARAEVARLLDQP